MIRQNKNGGFAVVFSRHVGTINGSPKTRSVYYGGLGSIEEARALRAKLEAANPPRRPGRKPRGETLLEALAALLFCAAIATVILICRSDDEDMPRSTQLISR